MFSELKSFIHTVVLMPLLPSFRLRGYPLDRIHVRLVDASLNTTRLLNIRSLDDLAFKLTFDVLYSIWTYISMCVGRDGVL